MHALVKSQVGEVLHPSMGTGHAAVVPAILRPGYIAVDRIAFQDIRWCRDLWFSTTMRPVLPVGVRDNNAREPADTAGLLNIPAEVQGQPVGTVERVLLVGESQFRHSRAVAQDTAHRYGVQAGSTDAKETGKVGAPSCIHLIQDG